MLSVGSRDDGRKGLGLGLGFRGGGGRGGMEENELEEGEACSGRDDDACINPDIALSYIDEKLQDVLGHFQKEFEGGVSAENLGAKFGGYGSFLPTYQRSPSIWSQPRSPPSVPNHNLTRSPCNSSLEVARQNPSVPTSVSIAKINHASASQSLDSLGNFCMAKINAVESVPQHDNKLVDGSDQKTLKVRIKVGPDNSLARNNAAIYSGLGLDISPSSSPENSPDGSGGLPPELHDAPDESPMTILQIMTCFSVPGGYLLSPLPDGLLQLSKKESTFLKTCKAGVLRKGIRETSPVVADLTMPICHVKGIMEMKMKSDEKNGRFMNVKNSDCKDDVSTILQRDIDNETPEGQKLVSDALNIALLSGSTSVDGQTEQILNDSANTNSRVLDLSKESSTISLKDRISSPDLVQDNQLESIDSFTDSGHGNAGNKTTHSRGKLNSKLSMEEKALEERNTHNIKEISSDMQREGISNIAKSDSGGYKGRKNHIAGFVEPPKLISAQKATSCETDGERILQGKDQPSESERRVNESQTNGTSAVELTKVNKGAISSVALKEKKNSHARGDHSENMPKELKSCKETSKGHSKESHRDVGGVDAKQVENRSVFLETRHKDKPKDVKLDYEKGSFASTEMSNDRPDAAAASHAHVFIKDNWVACDVCHEWRLLPHGIDPDHLPKIWQCSMQTWLPGLNKCHINEAVTTKALNALYQIPGSEINANLNGHHEVAVSTITSNDARYLYQRPEHDMQIMPTVGKKMHGLKDESIIQTSAKSRSLDVVTEDTSKLSDFTTEKHNKKHKGKHKIQGRYSDGGDFIEKNGKHSKLKSKREVDQGGSRSSKKIKKEDSHYPIEDWHSNLDVAGRTALSVDNDFSTKATGNNMQKYGDYASKDLKCDPKGHLPASIKRSKDQVHSFPNGEFKEHFSASDVEKSDTGVFSAKKMKIKEWQAVQGHQETLMSRQHVLDNGAIAKEAFSESEPRNQKKAKLSKYEGKECDTSRVNGIVDKVCSTRILLSGNREHPPDGMREGKGVTGKELQGQDQGSQRALDCTDYLKSDMAYAQPPAAATSSSSKVSGSRKSKSNFQEARGSPVESVSSSPLRTSNTEMLSTRRNSAGKDNVRNVGLSSMGSPKRCSDGEVDGGSDQSGTRRKATASVQQKTLESHRAAESGLDSLRGTRDFPDKQANLLLGKVNGGMDLKSGPHDALSHPKFEINVVNGTGSISDKHNIFKYKGPDEDHIHDRDKMNDHCRANGPSQRKSGKNSSLRVKGRDRSSKSVVDKCKLNVSDLFREHKESYTKKNGTICRFKVDIYSHDRSTLNEDFRDENYNVQENRNEKDYLQKKDASLKWSFEGRKDGHSDYGIQENLDAKVPPVLPKKHKDFDSRVAGSSCSKSNLQENLQHVPSQQDEKSSSHFLSDRIGRSEIASGRGRSLSIPPKDKQETQSCDPQAVPTFVNGRSEVHPIDAVNGDASKVVKQSREPDSQNCPRQATPNCSDASSPIRKDGHPAATVMLKEAIDLKHTANRLKKEGLELESTGLYFEAALKFLHVASLLEPPCFESARHGEAIQSMQMYSETARLCEYCAHEYERCKEMAAAALAYKCVEVAYMKVSYYKHPSASKDRHELQAALQMVPPGESPSSSASDVDNLNNHGTLDKFALVKGTASPQIAGNHVIAARNRPNFVRLLNYTNDLNSAFEATRKSQTAIAAASVNQGKDGVDGMSSVREVLDFNFHNVQGLLRLVRLSMESISR